MKEKHMLALKASQGFPNNWAVRRKSEPEIQCLIKVPSKEKVIIISCD